MNRKKFRDVVSETLIPMLQATLALAALPSTKRQALTCYINPLRLAVKPQREATYRLVLERTQAFTSAERELAGQFISELASIVELDADEYQAELVAAIPRRVIARHLNGGELLRLILEHLEAWSSQTYEGRRIVAAIGLDSTRSASGLALEEMWDQPFGPVLTNGFDTLVVVGSDGQIANFLQLSSTNSSSTAPYRLRELACWATGDRTSVVLNLHGEILVFQNSTLRFARRGGRWQHYVHDINIKRLSPPKDVELRRAIYESCLDVSFARSGGCIGVLDAKKENSLSAFVSPGDLLSPPTTFKTRLLGRFINQTPFQSLDRRARSELLSLDGALILNHDGLIRCAGTIIQVPGGSVGGGGRTAAAIQLSRIGLGVKVSQDGSIVGYRNAIEVFRT